MMMDHPRHVLSNYFVLYLLPEDIDSIMERVGEKIPQGERYPIERVSKDQFVSFWEDEFAGKELLVNWKAFEVQNSNMEKLLADEYAPHIEGVSLYKGGYHKEKSKSFGKACASISFCRHEVGKVMHVTVKTKDFASYLNYILFALNLSKEHLPKVIKVYADVELEARTMLLLHDLVLEEKQIGLYEFAEQK